jgi:hypothetical protein
MAPPDPHEKYDNKTLILDKLARSNVCAVSGGFLRRGENSGKA